jgi:hypothetical protein
MDWSAGVLWTTTGALFLRSSDYPSLLGHREMLLHMACREHVRIMCIRFLL